MMTSAVNSLVDIETLTLTRTRALTLVLALSLSHGDLYQGVELRARDLLGRYREIWGDMGRYREIQGDAGLGHETCTG